LDIICFGQIKAIIQTMRTIGRQVHKILKHKLQIFALTAAGQKLDGL